MKNKIKDSDLLTQFANGNNQAFGIIVERHSNAILATIKKAGIKDILLGEDFLQETFIKAMDAIQEGKYKEISQVKNWLARIARNLVVDHHRRKHNTPSHPDTHFLITSDESEGKSVSFTDVIPDKFTDDPESSVINNEIRLRAKKDYTNIKSIIRRMLESIPDEQMELIIMRYYFGFSFKEIAAKTKVPLSTAICRHRYALINLRRVMSTRSQRVITLLKGAEEIISVA